MENWQKLFFIYHQIPSLSVLIFRQTVETDQTALMQKLSWVFAWHSSFYRFLCSGSFKSQIVSAGRHDALFVVGSLDETIMLRGMRYHPIDIETSVLRSHRKICEWWVISLTNLHLQAFTKLGCEFQIFYKGECAVLGSLVGCAYDWYSGDCRCDPPVWQNFFIEVSHEIISTAILFLPLIQVGQLSVTGERLCTKYWLIAYPHFSWAGVDVG